jgi:2-keto-myo-inositol isomerase
VDAKLDAYLADHAVGELRALLERHDVKPIAIGTIEGVTFRPPAADVRQRLRQLCEVGAALGCREILVTPGPTPAGGASWDEVRAKSVRVLQELGDIAARYDTRVGFEFLGYPWSSVRTLAQAHEAVKQTGRGNVGLVLDTAQFYVGGSEVKRLLDVPQEAIDLVHISDVEDRPRDTIEVSHQLSPSLRSGTVVPGEGVVPLDDILIRLRHNGYDKPCVVVVSQPDASHGEWDPVALARQARAAALEYVGEYFAVE